MFCSRSFQLSGACIPPIFDQHESDFVASLLKQAPRTPDSDGAYLLPGNTVYISGPLVVSRPPYIANGYDTSNCAAASLKIETYHYRRKGSDWDTYSQTHAVGADARIGRWRVDDRYFENQYLHQNSQVKDSDQYALTCPTSARCRHTFTCYALQPTSVIGDHVQSGGHDMVSLPDNSLRDYPLLQAGSYTPAEFIPLYRDRMADRVKGLPLVLFFVTLFLNLCMYNTAHNRDKVNRLREPAAYSRKLKQRFLGGIFSPLGGKGTGPAWTSFILAILLPVLPLRAYNLLNQPDRFTIAVTLYVIGMMIFTGCLIRPLLENIRLIKLYTPSASKR